MIFNEMNLFTEQLALMTEAKNTYTIKYKYIYKPDCKIDCIAIGIDVGSNDESELPDKSGISHFLEHMVFNGSKNYTKEEINEQSSYMGGRINAATSDKYTQYYCSCINDYIDQTIRLLFDIVYNPLLEEDSVDKERYIILKEYDQCMDNNDRLLYYNMIQNTRDPRCKLLTIGSRKGIESITAEDLRQYHKKYYNMSNSVIAISTSKSKNEINEILSKVVNDLDIMYEEFDRSVRPEFDLSQEKREVVFYKPGTTQSSMLAYNIFNREDYIYGCCLSEILSNGLGARLTKRLREEKQLCYQCGTYVNDIGDGYSLVSMIKYSDSNRTDEIKKDIYNVYIECLDSITDYELQSAKNTLIGKLATQEHNIYYPSTRVVDIITNEPEFNIDDLQNISKEDIYKFINMYLIDEDSMYFSRFEPQ